MIINAKDSGSPHESGFLVSKRAMYEPGSVMVCSQKRACFAVSFGFLAILAVAVIVAFTKPGCPEARYIGEPVLGFHGGGRKAFVSKPIATNGEEFPWTTVKLPSYVQPLYYSLFIYPNFTTTLVKGNVSIIITAVEETKFIVLHIRDLNISHYSLQDKYKQRVSITKLLIYPDHQQIYLGLSNILHRGSNYSLNLIFESTLQEKLDGFYLSSYKDKEGHQRYLAATHFEPSSARSAFPCFDEPQFKARFQLSIVREPDMFSLFNMPQRASTSFQDTELIVDEFYETVEMSTYLVAFIVCDYSRVTNTTKDGMNVSIYAPYTMISQANYALQVSINILEYYEDFFGVAYTLPKLDLIAIPNFGPGAMENWGLIMYKETSLMFEPEHTSSRAQQQITMVIAHELAHQWFGNLVTMDWWQDLWLNEGFASFMENIGTEVAEPGWAMPEQFIVEKVQPALALDALITSHPISVPVHNPADIESIFDTVSYKKGASIISMLEVCVGRKILHSGLRNFLNDHRFSTADTVHLWRALNKAAEEEDSPLNVEAIMDTWTLQAGFPLISVHIDDVTINATQERFLEVSGNTTDPNVPLNLTLGYKWHVPLTYISSENPKEPILIWMNVTNVEFGIPKDLTWIKFNVGQKGFYRVNYDGAGWEMLTNLLLNDPERITAADRASIIDDAFTLVRGGRIKAKIALDLSLYLRNETAYAPWHAALSHFQDWVQLLFYDPTHTSMKAFIHSLVISRYNHLGWEDNGTHLEKLLRQEILWAAIECKDMKAISIAQEMFTNWKLRDKTVPPNLRFVVYSTGVRHGMAEDWMFCWKMYNSSQVPSERKLLLRALAQSRNPWILQQYLEYTLDRNKIRPQDVMTVLIEVCRNPGGTLAAWRMIRKHWNDVTRVFGTKTFSLGAIIKAVTEKFSSDFDYQEVKEFFEGKEVLPGARLIEQALETIRLHIQWLRINLDDVSHWLEKYLAKAHVELPLNII